MRKSKESPSEGEFRTGGWGAIKKASLSKGEKMIFKVGGIPNVWGRSQFVGAKLLNGGGGLHLKVKANSYSKGSFY